MTDDAYRDLSFADAAWTTPPASVVIDGAAMRVTAVEGSDAWRHTSYGFVHDSEHALLAPLGVGEAMEVEFSAPFAEQFDQAGLFLRAAADRWLKAGVEYADGVLNLGAVATDGMSDWSVAPVPSWAGRRLTVRVSRGADALTVRAAAGEDPLRLVRVVPFAGELTASAGPYVCAPTRAGLEVTFTAWRRTAADASLH